MTMTSTVNVPCGTMCTYPCIYGCGIFLPLVLLVRLTKVAVRKIKQK